MTRSTILRSTMLLSVMALTLAAARPVSPVNSGAKAPDRVDHILLWGRSIDEVTSILSVKLGFQIRPGHNPAGVANRYVRFADRGFVELLGITRANPELDPGMAADRAALKGAPGARSFGIYTSSLDELRSTLLKKNFGVTSIFSAPAPKSSGAKAPSAALPDWRLFAFDKQPLSSSLFYIDYAPSYDMQTSAGDDRILRTHPNGAEALSAVWLLSSSADADRRQLEAMGFGGGKAVRIPRIAARGYCVPVGPNYVLALEPDGSGISAAALSTGGPQVLGISILVADLDRAQRWAERGYERQLDVYDGALGKSVLAPTQDDLGLLVEFHSAAGSGHASGCGA